MTIDEKEKVRQMREQGLSYATIASILNISINTVKSFCKYHNYKKSNIRDENISYCQNCGKVLTQIEGKKTKRFCSDSCRYQWWYKHRKQTNSKNKTYKEYLCPTCGTKFKVYGNTTRKYCTHECYIKSRFKRNRNG